MKLINIFASACFLITACTSSETQNGAHYVCKGRALDNRLYYSIDSIDNNKKISVNFYYPLMEPGYRSYDSFPIVTFEFSDTAVCITQGLKDCPSKIVENTVDSFVLISYGFPSWACYEETSHDYKKLQKVTKTLKATLPSAQYDSSGIIDSLRRCDWVAKFKKIYKQDGVILKGDGFSFEVKFPEIEPKRRSVKELSDTAARLFPPFFIYSLKDYVEFFAPAYDHWNDYLSWFEIFGEWGPRPKIDESILKYIPVGNDW